MGGRDPEALGILRSTLAAVWWILLLVGLGAGLSFLVLNGLRPSLGPAASFAWRGAVLVGAFFAATAFVGARLGGLTWQQLGWCPSGSRVAWFVAGVVAGSLLAAAAIALAVVGSGATVRLRATGPDMPRLTLLLAGLCAAALCEELVFRGTPLALLARAAGRWPATIAGAAGFGAAHLHNPSASVFSTANIALAAVVLSIAFWSRGGMPLSWGLHFGWNAALGLVFGAPVSGIIFAGAPGTYAWGFRPWVDGGGFGPEGGVAATIAMSAGLALLVRRALRRPDRWLA